MQFSEPWKPHDYQKRAVKFLLEHQHAGLLLDPGLGKTSITLAAIKLLKQKKKIGKVLIVAPLRPCYLVWPNEIAKWTDFEGLSHVILHGPNKEEALKTEADIYLINPEGLDWLLNVNKSKTKTGRTSVAVKAGDFKKLGFTTLVIDELSKFKHPNTQRFKALKQVIHLFNQRWGLTGSPASNGLMDLFGQCYILDGGKALSPHITHYRNMFFDLSPWDKFRYIPRPGAEEKIYKLIAPLMLRMSAEEYLTLPEMVIDNIRVDLPDKAQAIYDVFEENLFASINDKIVVASNAATASMTCRQIAGGAVYETPDMADMKAVQRKARGKRDYLEIHDAKIEALKELIEELQGEPLLVAYQFKHELDRIREALGKDTPFVGGGVNTAKLKEIEAKWNRGEIPVLLGQAGAIAHGLNLQKVARHVCWFSLTWNYEDYDQLNRRIWRQGNKASHVFVHHIIARNTVDEALLGSVKSKAKGQNAFFSALQALAENKRRGLKTSAKRAKT